MLAAYFARMDGVRKRRGRSGDVYKGRRRLLVGDGFVRCEPRWRRRGHADSSCVGESPRHSVELAASMGARVRGLLFRAPSDHVTLVLAPCRDVHTFGMRHAIDVAFVGADGRVLEVQRNVSPCRRVRRRDAAVVVERFSREGPWLERGDSIWSSKLRERNVDGRDDIR